MAESNVATRVIRGRTEVTARALQRTVTAIAATQLRVATADVRVVLADEAGALGISVVAPVRLPSLSEAGGIRMIERTRQARDDIRDIATTTVGRTIGSVSVRLTRAVVLREPRVR
jgi:hypothetical protein